MRGLWLDGAPDPGTIEAEGYRAFGADLLKLTPAIIEDATERGLQIWSYWRLAAMSDPRTQAHGATDIALTIRQPTGSAIYFLTPPTLKTGSGLYVETIRVVCAHRGYIARFWREHDPHIPRGSRAGLWNYAPVKPRRERHRSRLRTRR